MTYSLAHLSDRTLLQDLAALVAQDRTTTAAMLAHLAEVDERRLYLPAGYPSMYSYCVEELRLSEDASYKRIQAARIARQFPALFSAVADGRLHLSGVVLLAPHLTAENAGDLLDEAGGRSKAEIEELLVRRFPRSERLTMVEALPQVPGENRQLAPGQVGRDVPRAEQLSPGTAEPHSRPHELAPLAPERYVLQLTIGQGTHDKLRYAQELLSHRVPNGNLAQVVDRALDALIAGLEKRKFAATDQPCSPPRREAGGARYVPADVRRAVWQRDRGRCTFISESGKRCTARKLLEFDHVDPVAQGGEATTQNIRLRCRGHNQYTAERAFGVEFMRRKRHEARTAAAARRVAGERRSNQGEQSGEQPRNRAEERARRKAEEVIPWLRALGIRADEAKRAAERCRGIPDASLEQRVRLALSAFGPRPRPAV